MPAHFSKKSKFLKRVVCIYLVQLLSSHSLLKPLCWLWLSSSAQLLFSRSSVTSIAKSKGQHSALTVPHPLAIVRLTSPCSSVGFKESICFVCFFPSHWPAVSFLVPLHLSISGHRITPESSLRPLVNLQSLPW